MKEPVVKGRVAAALKLKQRTEKYFAKMPLGKGYGRAKKPLFAGGHRKDILKKAWGYRCETTRNWFR